MRTRDRTGAVVCQTADTHAWTSEDTGGGFPDQGRQSGQQGGVVVPVLGVVKRKTCARLRVALGSAHNPQTRSQPVDITKLPQPPNPVPKSVPTKKLISVRKAGELPANSRATKPH